MSKCAAFREDGEPCLGQAQVDTGLCRFHSGRPPLYRRTDPPIYRRTILLTCGCERSYEVPPHNGERVYCPHHNRMAQVAAS